MKKLAMVIFLASMVGGAYAQAPAAAPAAAPAPAPAPAAAPAAAPAPAPATAPAAAPAPAPAAAPAVAPAPAPAAAPAVAPAAPAAESAPAAAVAEAPAVDPCAVDSLGQQIDPEGCAAAVEAARQQAVADSIAAEQARQQAIADSVAAEQARADSIAAAEEAARQQAAADSVAAAEAAQKATEEKAAKAPRFAVGVTADGGFGLFDVKYAQNHFKDFPFSLGVSGLFLKQQFGARLTGSLQYHRLYVSESGNRTINEGYWRAGLGLYGRWMPAMKEGLIVELGITGAWVTSDDIRIPSPFNSRQSDIFYRPQSEYDIELGAGYGITFAGMAGEIGAFVSYDLNETMEFTNEVDGSAFHIGARASFWILNF